MRRYGYVVGQLRELDVAQPHVAAFLPGTSHILVRNNGEYSVKVESQI